MAFSEDDIKISVTVDTQEAQKSVDNLKKSFDFIFKEYKVVFQNLSKVSKDFAKAQADAAKAEARVRTAEIDNSAKIIVAALKASSDKNIANIKKETEQVKQAEQTKQAAIAKTIAQTNLQGQRIRKNIVEIQQETAKIAAAGKIPPGGGGGGGINPEKQAGGFNILTASLGKTIGGLAKLQAQFYILRQTVSFVTEPIRQFNERIDELAKRASELEGLKTGFDTLQRSIGNLPQKAIEDLREATKGLISDTDLYQKANQAVLLNVPTDTFNEAAAAAVKLGRAMGVDAAFGLESLSIGLGRQSRLYLDNLGIVVSAQQAYSNFAREIGKSADQLTDAEKRSAFFAEALSKIKERAEELPDPLDTVGIALERLRVAQKNNETAASELFNQNKSLINAYAIQTELTLKARDANLALAKATADLGAVVKTQLAAGFYVAKIALAEFLEFFSREGLAPAKQIENLNKTLETTKRQLEKAKEKAERFGADSLIGKTAIDDIIRLNKRLAETEEQLRRLGAIQDEAVLGFKFTIPVDELAQASSDIQKQFSDLEQSAIDSLNLNNIPGLSIEQTQEIVDRIASIQSQFLETQNLEVFKNKIAEIRSEILELSATQYIAKLTDNLTESVAKYGAESEKAGVALANLKEASRLYAEGNLAQSETEKGLATAIKQSTKVVKERQAQIKKSTDANRRSLKQEERDLNNFLRKLKASSRDAISQDFVDRIIKIFNTEALGGDRFLDLIKKIRDEFKAAGGDVKILEEEIVKLKEQAEQGIKIEGRSEENEANRQRQDYLESIQEQMLNLRKIFTGATEGGGGFFGFDLGLGDAFGPEQEAQVAGSLQNALSTAFSLATDGFTRDDLPQLAEAVGSVIGTAIGASFGGQAGGQAGAVIGGEIGRIVGDALKAFGDDKPGTKERKEIDKYFADLFDGDRLGTVIEGEVFLEIRKRKKSRWGKIIGGAFDVLTGGITFGAGTAIGEALDRELGSVGNQIQTTIEPTFQRINDIVFEGFTRFAGFVRFGSEEVSKGFNAFSSYFQTLPQDIQGAFTGVGLAFGELLGISTEQSMLIGTALANNIGGSLQNLQVLVYQTGESLDQLSEKVIKSFLDSKITIQDAYNSLLALQNIFQQGIPNAIGATDEAIRNLVNSLSSTESPGLFAADSLRDIGVEAQEASQSFESAIRQLGEGFGFSAQQIQLLFVAFQTAGVTSLDQIANASDELTISILERIRQIREELVTTAEGVESIAIVPDIQAPTTSAPRGPSGPDPAKERADALKRLREETYRLLIASRNYADILGKINRAELTNIQGGREIRNLRQDIFKTLRRVTNLEAKYQEELDKGARASEKRLARLGKRLDEARKKLDDLTEAADETNDSSRKLDLSGIIPLIKDVNKLAVVSRQAGVDLEKNIDILVKGFLQGRLSISEVNAEIEKTKELLGPGIPNAVGAVTDAFQNLIDAGEQGGAFSVDAFTDIFAEFREKFEKEGSALRETQRQQLVSNLELAKQAFAQAVGPEATEEARKSLDLAKKALSDFYDEIPAPDLEDLRSALQAAFSPEQVDLFFRALDESGLKTFDDFEKAGADSVIGILGRLKELGFQFNETSDDIISINDGLIDAEKNANGGLDPLAEAIDLVRQFNEGASSLPPVFDATTAAILNMSDPLLALSDGFDNIIEKLGLLAGQTFENNIVFNVRTVGDSNSQALIDILFGDGSTVGGDVGGEGPGLGGDSGGGGSSSKKLEKFLRELEKLKTSGRGRSRRADILRRRIRILRGGGSGL